MISLLVKFSALISVKVTYAKSFGVQKSIQSAKAPHMLHITDLTYRIGDRLLLDQATVAIPAGHTVGLVGRNGAGKSTLINLILGHLQSEGGKITVRSGAKIGIVAQEAPDGPENLLETVIASNSELTDLNTEAETTTDPERIAYIHTRLADIDAHKAEARAGTILSGLGFDAEAQLRPCKSFSGGWRMRVALASVLFNQPDLLLLDEPTNYLDLEGVMWLENFLQTYPYTVLIISHDRELLNKAVKGILHLSEGKLNHYTGGYDRFELLRSQKMEQQMAMRTKQENERRHIQSFVDRFKAQASKARQAQSRIKALERMKPIATMMTEYTVPFKFPKPEPLSSPLIVLEETTVAYDPLIPILKKLDLRIDMDDRIALLGANGNGKSTFAKLLADRLKPVDGKVRKSRHLRVGYFAQHQLEELSKTDTAYELLSRALPEGTPEAKIRSTLGSFGFSRDKVDRSINSLSGGEQARLMFAIATIHKPHFLILDEPTNHLDVDSREALIHAINDYEGAVLLISHDRHILEACVDRLWIVADGDVKAYDGDLDDYKKLLLAERSGEKRNKKSQKSQESNGSKQQDKKARRKAAALRREALAPLKQKAKKAEAYIERLNAEREKVAGILSDGTLYRNNDEDKARLARLQGEAGKIDKAIEAAEAKWMKLTEEYDKAISVG